MTETNRRGARIALRDLTKRYGDQTVVDGVSLGVVPGEFMTLLGPSGSGKTTTLSMVAGFADPDGGQMTIDDAPIERLPAHRRDIGMVFQSYALFPHMTAAQNVAFPLRQRKIGRADRTEQVRRALETVRLSGYEHRFPSELSGGQQQRVALARAIVFQPRVLLMDEPLGALDRTLRDGMQMEIRRIHREVGSTVLFVTHDQEEALALSDRIAVFNGGRLEQVGTGAELYERPATLFVARFLGESTQLAGAVRRDGAAAVVDCAGVRVRALGDLPGGASGVVVVRPERLRLVPADAAPVADDLNAVPVTVTEEVYLGASRKLSVALADGTTGLVREPAGSTSALHPGDRALLTWSVEQGILLADAT
ncbi:ABC transporter ATP-binding protein [Conexibacter woesei]|uniref:ABC-type quaternary amine transporter n=1 Tax=Conexibacter woesei (strain DSM 14684 / CCUG 47730 / CIP 108061 / JCM 11494 / NBRC 100937 / ID131577) TaxID=469383 RepID=D3F8D5_CONWI|nr:ABC transporter ATP-binding protein [Conexibacter woesei]ADB49005.1 spermidine/putrescine ABC transporter ATPase subunit [Conexibacter woesei DSM 14684]